MLLHHRMFREDKRHGQGKFTWPDGAEYEGCVLGRGRGLYNDISRPFACLFLPVNSVMVSGRALVFTSSVTVVDTKALGEMGGTLGLEFARGRMDDVIKGTLLYRASIEVPHM